MTKAKTLMLLGGSVLCIRYIQAAQEMGLKVLAVDKNAQAPALPHADFSEPADIMDPQACLDAARCHGIDGVVAINDFGVVSAAKVAQELGLTGLSLDVAEIATSKCLMRETWRKAGAPTIDFRRVHSPGELKSAVSEMGLPAIIKPCNSSGGGSRGVMLLDHSSDLDEAYRYTNSFYQDDDILLEEYAEGLEHSVEAIIYQGKAHIIAVSDKVKSPLPYRVDDIILYPTVEKGQRMQWLREAVQQAVEAIGMQEGIAHVELTITDRGPVLFEIGARCGGGAPDPLVPYLSGVEEFKEAVRLALGERPQHLEPQHDRGCVIRFFYPKPGRITRIQGLEEAQKLPGVLSLLMFAGPGDEVKPLRTCGDRRAWS
jgi:biotin carboxylase